MSDKVLVCTTYGDAPHPRYWMSLLGLEGDWQFRPVHGKQGVDEGHNRLIDGFLNTDFDWMLHLDADAVVHPRTLSRLLSWGEPFVSALAFQRKPPYLPVVYNGPDTNGRRIWRIDLVRGWLLKHMDELQGLDQPFVLDDRNGALVDVDRSGAHCLLCHRSVLEAIPPPWFARVPGRKGGGSDFHFTSQAIKAGFAPKLDLGTIAGHLCSDWCVGPWDFMAWDAVTDVRETEDGIQIVYRIQTKRGEEMNNGTD